MRFRHWMLLGVAGVASCLLASCGGAPGSRSSGAVSQLMPAVPSQGLSSAMMMTNASASGPYHIATWAYDIQFGQGQNASAADINRLVSYADDGPGGKALRDCNSGPHRCKSVFYARPNHLVSGSCSGPPDSEELRAAPESWFVHDLGYSNSTHRVYGLSQGGCRTFAMNPDSPGHQDWWRRYLQNHADGYDVYFFDTDPTRLINSYEFPSGGGCKPWPSICLTTQEIRTDFAQMKARVNFANAMRHTDGRPMDVVFNKAYPPMSTALDTQALSLTRHFVAVDCEDCVIEYRLYPNEYANTLDEMSLVNHTQGAFVFMSQGSAPTGSNEQTLERLVTTAMVWLGYSEGHTIVWPDLETNNSRLAIWPEDLIYPSSPIQTMFSGAFNLQVAPGVFRREFTNCYSKGLLFGHCAAIVNANGYAVTVRAAWFNKSYGHVITLHGGDELAGGVADIRGANFVSGSTRVEAGGALLLAK